MFQGEHIKEHQLHLSYCIFRFVQNTTKYHQAKDAKCSSSILQFSAIACSYNIPRVRKNSFSASLPTNKSEL